MISLTQFNELAAQGYNRIPLTLERFADLETPLSLYLKLANRKNSFLLESVLGGERFGRYSIIGLPARRELITDDRQLVVVDEGEISERCPGPALNALLAYQQRYRAYTPPAAPRFCGGLVGYFAYDAVREMEPKLGPCQKPDPLSMPDIHLLHTDSLAVIDNIAGKIWLIHYVDPADHDAYRRGETALADFVAALDHPLPRIVSEPAAGGECVRDFAKADYLAAVERAQRYIADGDMMQVQIGQRIRKPFGAEPIHFYRALRSLNPSPYMYFYHFGDTHVVGASPEILVRQEKTAVGERVTIRPLAGTRPRGRDTDEDQQLAHELLADPKEIAEHVMLIDLARNDIGRIATVGSVRVTEQMVIERYSHVMHIVSNVEGILKPGLGPLDVLAATFPAGTLSGAPKIRAMEIIDELEPVKRGLYGGACGYLSYSGDMDLAIAIRTGIIRHGQLYVQAAAGIVADSIPENEWQETENKARALIRAAEMAEAGLDTNADSGAGR